MGKATDIPLAMKLLVKLRHGQNENTPALTIRLILSFCEKTTLIRMK